MAGGTWRGGQVKNRAGVYINFEAVPRKRTSLGSRGVVALPMALSWGDDVIEVLSEDLATGKSLAKVGLTLQDEEVLLLKAVLQNSYKALVYRVDEGGVNATAVLGELMVSALYPGVFGNEISVEVKESKLVDKFEVITYVRGKTVDRQIVEAIEELEMNDYVMFAGEGALEVTAGTHLADGENGEIDMDDFGAFLKEMKKYRWNTMAVPYDDEAIKAQVAMYIANLRETTSNYVQAVLIDHEANHEGIISVKQGFKTADEIYSPETFSAYAAGLIAGAGATDSLTYHVIPGATEIINALDDEQIEEALADGHFVLSERQDGAIVIEKDINTLVEFTQEKPEAYSKNRVIRTLDSIADWLVLTFSKSYIGKVDNNDDGRNLFKAEVISYLSALEDTGAITNFGGSDDVIVEAGEQIDGVYCRLQIQPVDSMEKLYADIKVKV